MNAMNTFFVSSTDRHQSRWLVPVVGLLLACIFLLAAAAHPVQAEEQEATARTTYYVDCRNGSDSRNGRSQGQAWRSLNKANRASLQPGDSLLFKRGCKWGGTLRAKWHGTASRPILIGAYGSGNRPVIHNRASDLRNRYHANVLVTGSHQIIEHFTTYIVNPPVVRGCRNNPIGFYVGFNFRGTGGDARAASHNVLRNVEALRHTAGVHLTRHADHNRIENSSFRANHVMSKLTPKSQHASDDIGAWGILIRGDHNEVVNNFFTRNNAWCTYDTAPQGNSVEIYQGRHNNIHHNTSLNDRVFSELGGSRDRRAEDNRFAYNLVTSNVRDARFVVVRGGGNPFGPTRRTHIYHNTVYYTGSQSQALVCHSGCSNEIARAEGNIFWAQEKAIYADGRFHERNNIFWNRQGDPFLQLRGFEMHSSSRIADPRFRNPGARQFQLRNNSPAINEGSTVYENRDLLGNRVPSGGAPDIGAYEWRSGGQAQGQQPVENYDVHADALAALPAEALAYIADETAAAEAGNESLVSEDQFFEVETPESEIPNGAEPADGEQEAAPYQINLPIVIR